MLQITFKKIWYDKIYIKFQKSFEMIHLKKYDSKEVF